MIKIMWFFFIKWGSNLFNVCLVVVGFVIIFLLFLGK